MARHLHDDIRHKRRDSHQQSPSLVRSVPLAWSTPHQQPGCLLACPGWPAADLLLVPHLLFPYNLKTLYL